MLEIVLNYQRYALKEIKKHSLAVYWIKISSKYFKKAVSQQLDKARRSILHPDGNVIFAFKVVQK